MRKYQFVLTALLVVAISGTVSYAVSAAVPSALLTAGTTRYAFVQNSTQANLTTLQLGKWVSAGVPITVTIPAGKVADVVTIFCSVANADSFFIKVKGSIGNTALQPNGGGTGLNLLAGSTGVMNSCISFQKASVPAGSPTVNILWEGMTVNTHLFQRSLVVILNIH